jgi:hypothetical protein
MLTVIAIAAVVVILALLSEDGGTSDAYSSDRFASPARWDDRPTPAVPLTEYRYVEGRGGQVVRPTGYGTYQGVTTGETYKGFTHGSLRE